MGRNKINTGQPSFEPGHSGEVDQHIHDAVLGDFSEHPFLQRFGLGQLQDRTALVVPATCPGKEYGESKVKSTQHMYTC